ncbi:YbjQ family protein [Faecalibacter bovis]|uniref:Heavy metal-binding domain-containing protein n=1 Tax=Faecalibacter bovis TaxID=2898187 RepID=A0ABX7XBU6_9FLAO|nr:heavy metal-binding domain-containing protein [Faecalibacter bovis]QTV05365.1 heavy metal-binding domain-containing protein [Faecalibacter bovis]
MKKLTNPKEILVLTTTTVGNYKIVQHFNPVTSHVVAGTNLISDFIGGLSDVFGGRSIEFQKQIASIYDEAINKLKLDAYRLGANCIVGLKIDVDEISGKGKSMFMITAIGTPILFENNEVQKDQNNIVSADYLNNLIKTRKTIKELTENKANITNEFWELIINNEIKEAFDFLIVIYEYLLKNNAENEIEPFKVQYSRYLQSLDSDIVIDKLYKYLKNSNNTEMNVAIYKIIEELNLIDFNKIKHLLQSENHIDKKIAILLTRFDKAIYDSNDIAEIEDVLNSINNNVKEIVTYTTKKKGMFSSEEIEVWKCTNSNCGHTNNKENEYCEHCYHDKYGFNAKFYNKNSAIENLTEKIEILKEQLL